MTGKLKTVGFLAGLALILILGFWLYGAKEVNSGKQVLIIGSSPSHQEPRMMLLKKTAREAGIQLQHVFTTELKDEDYKDLLKAYNTVIIDISNKELADDIYAKAKGLDFVVQVFSNARNEPQFKGIAPEVYADLRDYYVNGALVNYQRMFAYLQKHRFGQADLAVEPPIIWPSYGVYHPEYKGLMTSSTDEYLDWIKEKNRVDDIKSVAVIGLMFARSAIETEQQQALDQMIAQVEKKGAIPLALFFEDRPGNKEAVQKIVMKDDKSLVNVLISTVPAHVPLERQAEFEKIGVPVLGSATFRPGEQKDWEMSSQGIPMSFIPTAYSTPEYMGIVDTMLTTVITQDLNRYLIDYQFDSLVNKAINLTRLQTKDNADKRVTLMFYNSPMGEKNLSASNMNIPVSLEVLLANLKEAGYSVSLRDEQTLIEQNQRLLSPFYRDNRLEGLLADGLAQKISIADYKKWLGTLPASVQQDITKRWGEPETSSMAMNIDGEGYFIVPALKLDNFVIMPQPPRGDKIDNRENALYHDSTVPPNHFYLAAYLWAKDVFNTDAFIHFGTHGTQEWMPGKERGLSVWDAPNLAVGDVPVFYPYIVANIGEAIQAKRRGRAVIITHQTPPFAPSGLYDDLIQVHELIHNYENIETPSVRANIQKDLVELVVANNYHKDMGINELEAIEQNFEAFVGKLHDYLHVLAEQLQPLGLHHFNVSPEDEHRLFTVMQTLGKPFYIALVGEGEALEELFAADYSKLTQTVPFQFLVKHVLNNQPLPKNASEEQQKLLAEAKDYWDKLDATSEFAGLAVGLNGGYVSPSSGDDIVRNPDSHQTGRNVYGFDPAKVPSKQAWEVSADLIDSLVEQHKIKNNKHPEKLAFTLWAVETMRQQGVAEAQVFRALGVKPVWDKGQRVVGVELIPTAELKYPRIDVLVSITGAYRDMFPNAAKRIDEAVRLVAELEEEDNLIYQQTKNLEAELVKEGLTLEEARRLAIARIFGPATGDYGVGLEDAALASDTWGEGANGQDRKAGEAKLADLYMSRLGHVWSEDGEAKLNVDLLKKHLGKVDAAVLSRSSNLYGLVNIDDAYQYLGGLALAVRSVSGKSPDLFISDLRNPQSARTTPVDQFISTELRTRYFHPNWIEEMKKEGYAGATQFLDIVNNFWGWQVMTPEVVREDQWKEFFDIYVADEKMQEFFEKTNPTALAQIAERMLEAVRKEYWDADDEVKKKLVEVYQEMDAKHDVFTDNALFKEYLDTLAKGYGLSAKAAPDVAVDATMDSQANDSAADTVQGQVMAELSNELAELDKKWWLALFVLVFILGLAYQAMAQRRNSSK